MKKILIILVALFMAYGANAQKYGLKIGGNALWASVNPSSDGGRPTVGLNGGFIFEKQIIPVLGIVYVRAELLYAEKGYAYKGTILGGEYNTTTKYAYVELPVLAKVKIGPWYILGGGYGAYAISGKTKGTVSASGVSTDIDVSIDIAKDGMKDIDFGATGGVGMQFGIPLIPVKAFAELRMDYGIANLMENPIGDYHFKNMALGLTVGATFGK